MQKCFVYHTDTIKSKKEQNLICKPVLLNTLLPYNFNYNILLRSIFSYDDKIAIRVCNQLCSTLLFKQHICVTALYLSTILHSTT